MRAFRVLMRPGARLTALHPDWLDYLHLRNILAQILADPHARVLLVREKSQLEDNLASPSASLSVASPGEVSRGKLSSASGDLRNDYTHVLIYLKRADYRHTRAVFEQCRPILKAERICYIFIHRPNDQEKIGESVLDLGDFASDNADVLPADPPPLTMAQYLERLRRCDPKAAALSFVGGRLKQLNRRLISRLSNHYGRFGVSALVWILPVLIIALPFGFLSNLYLRRRSPSSQLAQHCSSVLIRISRGSP
jgi:hypothetical protein